MLMQYAFSWQLSRAISRRHCLLALIGQWRIHRLHHLMSMTARVKWLGSVLVFLLAFPAVVVAAEAQNAFNAGVKFYKAGKFKEAVNAFNRAIKAAPKSDEAYNNRGLAYFKLGQHDNAIKDYDEAIKLNPKTDESYNNRGNAYS